MIEEVKFSILGILVVFGAWCSAQTTTGCTPSCQNNGTCTQDLNSNSYYCDCTGTGFEGTLTCGTSPTSSVTPPVASSSSCPVACQNGTCTPEFNSVGYYCACNPGFQGDACNVSSGQSPTGAATSCPLDCQNGRCEPQFNSDDYQCVCNSGYTGVSCATRTAAPSPSTAALSPQASPQSTASACPMPCVHGSCRQDFNSDTYWCQCSSGWTGAACNTADTTAQDAGRSSTGSMKGWEVFVIVLAVVVGVVLIGSIGVIIWKKRSRRATFVKFNDSTFEPQQVEVLGKQRPHGSHTQV